MKKLTLNDLDAMSMRSDVSSCSALAAIPQSAVPERWRPTHVNDGRFVLTAPKEPGHGERTHPERTFEGSDGVFEAEVDEHGMPKRFRKGEVQSSDESFFGRSTIVNERDEPYMTRYWIGRLRLHIFHRGDPDDCHDHPGDFRTFPLTSYVEEVVMPNRYVGEPEFETHAQVVRAFRLHFRPAEHTHRVLGRWNGQRPATIPNADSIVAPGKVITIVWWGKKRRKWGFLKQRDGKWCWITWRDYVFNGGKAQPCP